MVSTREPATCLAETDGLRCSIQNPLYYGYCYYHHKMSLGLIQPSKEIGIVRTAAGVTLYKNGKRP